MSRFKVIHAFFLKSANKLMLPGTIHSTGEVPQIEELRDFASRGSCQEIVPASPDAKDEAGSTVDPADDITVVPGMTKTLLTSLEEMAITKLSGLKAAMADNALEEKLRAVLGPKFEKIQSYFQAA